MKRIIILVLLIFISGCNNTKECNLDSDCVAAECCHSTSCVSKAPDCKGVMCTMECKPGTLDCGQGSCKCLNGNCEAVFK